MKNILSLTLFIPLLILSTCDPYSQDSFEEVVVVEAYLVAGQQLPVIRVSRTLPADQEYTFQAAALNGANIQVVKLDDEGNEADLFEYVPHPQVRGIYQPAFPDHTVEPLGRYRLDLDFDNRPEVIRARTRVPDQITVTNTVPDTVIYQSEEQLELILAPTASAGRQNVFVFDTVALNPSAENLTPFYRAAVENENAEIEDFLNNSSGLINEGNFELRDDGSIALNFPWIGTAFFEDNLVITNSVDSNLNDLIRSQSVQLGGSTLPPGEIPNLIYNIEGGIGIFGSLSSDTVQTYFARPLP